MITVDICSTAISMNIIIKPRKSTTENDSQITCPDSTTVCVCRSILLKDTFISLAISSWYFQISWYGEREMTCFDAGISIYVYNKIV